MNIVVVDDGNKKYYKSIFFKSSQLVRAIICEVIH